MTALHISCKMDASRIDIVSNLIAIGNRGLAILQKDNYGFTALHYGLYVDNNEEFFVFMLK